MEDINAYEKEIAFLSKKILELNNKLIDSEKAKSNFISLIANQLNNPMTVLLGIMPHLKEQICEKNEELFCLINQEFNNLEFKITNLVTAAQIESGTIHPFNSLVSLSEIIHEITESLQYVARDRNIQITTQDKINEPIIIDPNLIYVIIKNLVTNAVVFADEDSEVKICFEKEDSLLKLSVQNKGEGPNTKFKPEVFTRFSKGPEVGHGLGIGLSIVNELCIIFDGSVDYTVTQEHVTFNIVLRLNEKNTTSKAFGSNEFIFDDLEDAIEL